MTLHKLTAGDGYLYLMRHVAKADADGARIADAAAYYTAEGNPPGVWLGAGSTTLGLTGTTVTEAQMRNLFGTGAHPDAERIMAAYLREHTRPGLSDRARRELAAAAQREAQLGRRFAEYAPLAPLSERVAARVTALQADTGRPPTPAEVARIRGLESRRAAGAVAGYDLVFSPVKSLALLWALDPRPHVREAIRHAHEAAMTETLAFLEANAAHTRTGADGLAQVDTTGLVAVAFTHYDSRAGDPNLHTHVAISNKIQGLDGVWRALDARDLHAMAVTASEHYNTRVQAHTADRLGVTFEARETARGRRPVMEVAGIDQQVLDHFSRRRAQLEARYDQLLAEYRTTHGRDPDFAAARALADRANLQTRTAKGAPRSLEQMRQAWREDLTNTFGADALTQVITAVSPEPTAPGPASPALVPGSDEHTALVAALAADVVAVVEATRSTWSVWNLRAEAERALRHPDSQAGHRLREATATQLAGLAQAVTVRAAEPELSLRVDPPSLVSEPASLRRADGASVFARHGADRYTSQHVLDAEHRLLTAATATPSDPAAAPSRESVGPILDRWAAREQVRLDAGQAALVTAFATDPRTIVVGLGPAGTGKTTAMRALEHVLDQAGTGKLIPLATSAHAAAVLAAELDVRTENVHKFLHDHTAASPDRIRLEPGDVVLVDEAGMAGTPNLDRLLTLVQDAGARLRLLGDDRQLAAVESGGALRLLAEQAGAVELDVVHRFADPAEAAATLALRTGDHRALGYYRARGRIHGGSQQDMTDRAYSAWLADVHAGRTSVLATTTTADVTRLAARARTDRVAAGQVEPDGVALHDGNTAGVGDWIVTRANDRRLTTPDRHVWVRNGDAWRVLHRRDDGALTVAHLTGGTRLVLPAGYVAAHVELLYATTAHRVQGATVDTAHALITPDAAREHLYVLATRARASTHMYVQTHHVLPVDEDERADRRAWDPAGLDATVILQRVLDRQAAEPSATTAIRDAQNAATSLATLVPRYEHAVAHATVDHYLGVLRAQLSEADFAEVQRDDAAPNLVAELRRTHQAGWQPEQALARAVRDARAQHLDTPHNSEPGDAGHLGTRSMARLIAENLRGLAASLDPPIHLHRPEPHDLDRYQALLTDHGIDLGDVRPTAALEAPLLLRVPGFDDPGGVHGLGEITTSTYRMTVAQALPPSLAATVLQDQTGSGWRTLQLVLRRAETAGHDIPALLATPGLRRTIEGDTPVAVQVAERLTHLLADHPTPALTGPQARTRDGATYAWAHLAWALKAVEAHGGDPVDLLPAPDRDASATAGPGQVHGLVAAWLDVQAHARPAARPDVTDPVLPWVPDPVPGTVPDAAEAVYLHELRTLIADRVTALRHGVEAAVLADDVPVWARSITSGFARYEHSRPAWLDHAQTVAAFLDQYPAPTADPDQPLGPHPEPAPHTDRAHARAHAAAAYALARAFDIAHPTGTRRQPAGGLSPAALETRRQLAITSWTALDPQQKVAVAATVLARLGTLPAPTSQTDTVSGQACPAPSLGSRSPQISGLDDAVTHPNTVNDLHRALVSHGHLADPSAGHERHPDTDDTARPRRGPGAGDRTTSVRPPRRPVPERPAEPTPPAPDERRRYDPQPGRPEPRPGRQYRL